MLISHKYRCIFIHIQKTGGSTIESLLRSFDKHAVLKVPLNPIALLRCHLCRAGYEHARFGKQIWLKMAPVCKGKHLFARDIKTSINNRKIWETYFKFAFVRNPWDRLVSWYSMIRERGPKNAFWKYALENSSDFESFVRNCNRTIYESPFEVKNFFFNQFDYISGDRNEVIVDYIGRFENFTEDVQRIFRSISCPLPKPLPKINQSTHPNYRRYYTDETRKLVTERYYMDIGFFGYRF